MDAWKNPSATAHLIRFPPLYSEQVPENKEAQFRIWTDILVAWAKSKKVWSISLQECPVFRREDINREAPMSLRQEIISYMTSKGYAFWIGSSQHSQAYVLPKSVEDWCQLIISSLEMVGTTNPVQAHELVEDIDYADTEFNGMPEELMELLLQKIVEKGDMVTFKVNGVNSYKLVKKSV